mmetsp:Transcript_22102/g.32089  ORF Transcript_22102/g.32089 Transcript_22102/m.32089 type:complete len:123 (-) Transcript_22102:175-543(-)
MAWRSKISTNLHELFIYFSGNNAACNGVRAFITNNYTELKMLNPTFPFLHREFDDAPPCFFARYDCGEEKRIDLAGLTEKEITVELKKLVDFGEHLDKSPSRFDPGFQEPPIVPYDMEWRRY